MKSRDITILGAIGIIGFVITLYLAGRTGIAKTITKREYIKCCAIDKCTPCNFTELEITE